MPLFLIKKHGIVFNHIPKNGGGSIRNGFFNNECDGPSFGSVPEEWKNQFHFAFVRNPYDRIVSAWKMFTLGMQNADWERPTDLNPETSFKQFLELAIDDSITFLDRETTLQKLRQHTIPQVHPFNCLDQADFVGRYENLEEDFAAVCQMQNIEFNGLDHWNKTVRDDYRDYYDTETKAIVDQFLKDDINSLGYTF